jgi:hypothetical protein
MSAYNKSTWHHIPEDGILHSHDHENLKNYFIVHGLFFKQANILNEKLRVYGTSNFRSKKVK